MENINHETLKRIMSTPEGIELGKYIGSLILSLDTLEGIDKNNPEEATIEMKARQKAIEKLKTLFSTLIFSENDPSTGKNEGEYVM